MVGPIVVVDADKARWENLCVLLGKRNYRTIPSHSLSNAEETIDQSASPVVILDLDILPVDNRFIFDLKKRNPGVLIIGLSSRPFHPELSEAISKHFYACLYKPLDTEELFYWLRSIYENETNEHL